MLLNENLTSSNIENNFSHIDEETSNLINLIKNDSDDSIIQNNLINTIVEHIYNFPFLEEINSQEFQNNVKFDNHLSYLIMIFENIHLLSQQQIESIENYYLIDKKNKIIIHRNLIYCIEPTNIKGSYLNLDLKENNICIVVPHTKIYDNFSIENKIEFLLHNGYWWVNVTNQNKIDISNIF